ncbi:MAG TPA: helix-turn-helix domain-containing protein [Mycobacteriales bacterium]|nr:helix-turn-helix domain-containing protein [Mycobacteriales bacterium]
MAGRQAGSADEVHEVLAAVAAGAAADSGVPATLLGDFLVEASDAIISGRRLTERRVQRYERHGEEAAALGVGLSALVDLYLSAAWRLWRELPALRERTAGQRRPAQLLDAGVGMLRTSDDVVAAVASGYQRAHADQLAYSAATRREFIDDLLTHHGAAGELAARSEAFGLHLAAGHRVAVIRDPGRRIDDGKVVVGYAMEACRSLPGSPAYLVSTKDGNLIFIVEGAEADTRAAVAQVVARLRESTSGLEAGVGRSRSGEAGPMRSFREAADCLLLGERLGLSGDAAYADDLIAYLALARDPDLLVELVTSVLTPLAGLRGGAADAIDTLQAYLDNHASATATARALHLSVRGLTYRMERIQGVLSRDLDDSQQRLTVELALLAARLLDWPAQELPALAS